MNESADSDDSCFQSFAPGRAAGEHRRSKGRGLLYEYEVAWNHFGEQVVWAARVTQAGTYKGESSGAVLTDEYTEAEGSVIAAVCHSIDELSGIAE